MKTIQKNSLFSAILLSGAVLLGAATHAKADVNISIDGFVKSIFA